LDFGFDSTVIVLIFDPENIQRKNNSNVQLGYATIQRIKHGFEDGFVLSL